MRLFNILFIEIEKKVQRQWHCNFIIFLRSLRDFRSFSMNKLYARGVRPHATFWMYCLSVSNGWECCRYLRISDKVVNVIFIAVSIRAATL
jgi:hypothetical protein